MTAHGGTVAKVEYWGVKSLAFRIKKNRKAHFTLLNIDAPSAAVVEMERQLGLNEDVIRVHHLARRRASRKARRRCCASATTPTATIAAIAARRRRVATVAATGPIAAIVPIVRRRPRDDAQAGAF